jgi:hypothetical protein
MDRIREGGDRPDTREGPGGGDVIRCGPNRYGAPTDAGEERPRSCEDVRARLYLGTAFAVTKHPFTILLEQAAFRRCAAYLGRLVVHI